MTILTAPFPVRAFAAVAAAAAITVASVGTATPANAAPPSRTYYVAASGSDHNSGTNPKHPLRTLEAAQRVVRRALTSHQHGVQVLVGGGTYELSHALDFGPKDSGSPTSPVTWEAMPGQRVTIAGGRQIKTTWTADPSRPGVYRAQIDKRVNMDGLFVNGQRQVLARYPNVNPKQKILDGYTTLADINARSRSWAHPELADLRALHCNTWGGASFAVTGRDTTGNLVLKWVGDNNRAQACSNPAVPIDPNHAVAENVLEELDAPGEWYLNAPSGTLYYYPPAGTDLSTATVQTAEQDELIHIEGSSSVRPVRDLTFAGFTFTATHRTLFDHAYEPLQLGDWTVARTGAFYTKNAKDITVTNSIFDQLGGNAVFMDGYNNGNVVSNSRFSDNGATDVQTVGSRDAGGFPQKCGHRLLCGE